MEESVTSRKLAEHHGKWGVCSCFLPVKTIISCHFATSLLGYHWLQFVGFFTIVLLHSVSCSGVTALPLCCRCVFWTPPPPDSSVSAVVANIIEEERLRQLLCLSGKHAAPRHMLFILSHYCARFIHTLPHKYQCSQMSIQNLYIILGMPAMCCGCHC